jgi:GTPase SAR1 family protein
MNGPNDAQRQADAVRKEAIGILEELEANAVDFELTKPPEVFSLFREKLTENTYNVLVVGEAKRGKSTFVNALIGRDVLPTDVDVSTSRVFCVTHAEREAYRLRFEDGSQRPLSLEELKVYGSQAEADEKSEPQLAQVIRWIEVDVPVTFIPKGVSILDTPGLGALYAAHAQITYRFVPQADAVIFVLDSEQPVMQSEIDFVETLLNVTKNILFIQTKIDAFGDAWRDIKERNEEELIRRFGYRIGEVRVWPISSTNLRRAAGAASEDAEALLMVARHRELAAALQSFLFRVAGWARAAEAILAADEYQSQAYNILSTRLAALTDESKRKVTDAQQSAMQRKREFEIEWGHQGGQRKELLDGIRRAITIGRRRMSEALQPGREIALEQEDKINAVKSVKEANELGAHLAADVLAAATNEWRQVCNNVHNRCERLLEPFLHATSTLGVTLEEEATVRPLTEGFRGDWWGRIKSARMDFLTAGAVGGVFLFTPFAPIAIAGLVWATIRGWRTATKAQIDAAKRGLREHLHSTLVQVRRHFTDVAPSSDRFSRVDEYFDTFERTMNAQIQVIVAQKSEDVQREVALLSEQVKLNEEQRQAKAAELRQHLKAWEQIGKRIAGVVAQLEKLG